MSLPVLLPLIPLLPPYLLLHYFYNYYHYNYYNYCYTTTSTTPTTTSNITTTTTTTIATSPLLTLLQLLLLRTLLKFTLQLPAAALLSLPTTATTNKYNCNIYIVNLWIGITTAMVTNDGNTKRKILFRSNPQVNNYLQGSVVLLIGHLRIVFEFLLLHQQLTNLILLVLRLVRQQLNLQSQIDFPILYSINV